MLLAPLAAVLRVQVLRKRVTKSIIGIIYTETVNFPRSNSEEKSTNNHINNIFGIIYTKTVNYPCSNSEQKNTNNHIKNIFGIIYTKTVRSPCSNSEQKNRIFIDEQYSISKLKTGTFVI